jgi:acylphosphatase
MPDAAQVKISKHYWVSGKVQGVWFRMATQKQAQQLGVTGWVKNLADGRVEVLASGDAVSLNTLTQWLHEGPELAQVTEVLMEDTPLQLFDRFAVK